jgi:outer membrane receptor protein involved in Fe transport
MVLPFRLKYLFRHLQSAELVLVVLGCSPIAAVPVIADDSSGSPAASTNATTTLPPVRLVQSVKTVVADPEVKLETVVVSAELDAAREQIAPSLGAVTYTIGPNQIQAIPQGENAPFSQVLLRAPGVVADSLGEVHVRGEHGDLTYRLNGVLLPEGLNGFGQELDTRLIHSVTLIDGSLPAQFGFRTAGIVDVKTKSGDQLGGNEFSLYGGSYGSFEPSVQLGGTTNRLDYFVAASYKHNDLGIENPTASVWPLHDHTDQEKIFAYLSYRVDDTSRISLLLNGSYGEFQLPNRPGLAEKFQLVGTPSADSASVNENQNEQNYYAVLAYQKSAGELSFQVSAYTRYGQIHFSPDPVEDLIFQGVAGDIKNSFLANGLQVDGSYVFGDHHTLRAGLLADYTLEKLDTSTLVFPVAANGRQTTGQAMKIVDNNALHGLTAGVYLQDEWRLTDQLTLNYGARYDRFDASFDHEGQLSPRANLVWQVDGKTSAHIGYARYFTPPSVQYIPPGTIKKFDGTSNAPFNDQDDPTRVERAHYFDGGLSREFAPGWQVTADAFYKEAQNLIDLGQFGSAVILSPFSYRQGRVYGSELSTTYKRGPFSTFANFSYVVTSARDINSAQFEFPNDELTYVQTHNIELDHEGRYTVSAGVAYTWERNTRFYADFLYGYGLRTGFANTGKLPGYEPFNLGMEHVFRTKFGGVRQIKLRFDCINVADEVYQLRAGSGLGISASQYGQRRSLFAGVTAGF